MSSMCSMQEAMALGLLAGAVRDVMLGLNPKEYDICTTATPEEIVESFEDTIPTGIRYGTVTVRCGDSMFEVTTLRTEKGYGDGRRPDEVEWGHSLGGDLSRRDFTMNAMAYDLARGLLHDPFEGRNDLKQGKLRAVGIAGQRLSEDGLRIMRAYRFMDRGEIGVWLPDSELSDALIDNRAMLAMVSIERIWNELERDSWIQLLYDIGKNEPRWDFANYSTYGNTEKQLV